LKETFKSVPYGQLFGTFEKENNYATKGVDVRNIDTVWLCGEIFVNF